MRTLLLVLLLGALGCGAPGRTLYVRGSWAESYGFACECGSRHFQVLVRIGRVWMVCVECGKGWEV